MKIKKGLILPIMSFVFLWLPTAPVVAQQGTGKEVIAPIDVADKKDSRAQDDTRKRRKPRIMVVVHSMEISSSFFGVALEGNRNAENQVESSLIQNGFQLVDAGQIGRKKELETLLMKEDPSIARKMARDFGADILVQVQVRRTFVDVRPILGRPTRFFSNEIRLKAFKTDTASVLFSGYRTRPPSGAGALLPLEDATTELCEDMIKELLENQGPEISQAETYELNISGASFSSLSRFKKQLRDIHGLNEVQIRNFHSGHALLEVEYQGPLGELAEEISNIKNPSLQVIGLQSNTLEIKLGE